LSGNAAFQAIKKAVELAEKKILSKSYSPFKQGSPELEI
jgi:hypothetical protein